ncbi:MAG TPA: universal stress protein [Vicinamibacterales bacterium]|nr:universal stress protein [Vicinamibacterales bacterium]
MIALKKVLVATDFGPAAESALRYGRALARGFGAELHLLHVVDNLFARAVMGYAYAAISPAVQEDLERAGRRQAEALLGDDDRRDLHAVAATMTSTSPADAIVEYARTHAIDLVIIGTHGRGPVAHLLLGNVAERVVRIAPCPVLTVREHEHEFVLPDALVPAAEYEPAAKSRD